MGDNCRVDPALPVIVPYRAEWPARSAAVRSALGGPFSGHSTRFEHIGSTAIPGMAAKDVLDLQVSVTDLAAAAAAVDTALAGLGFARSPYQADHVPAGRTDDPAGWAKRLWLRRGHPGGDVNLHVRRAGAPNERLALLFRDWFRAHAGAVPAYGGFKAALAAATGDLDTYTEVKDPVVDLVVATAEKWVPAAGWAP
jgi:dephospho-CoA kinase